MGCRLAALIIYFMRESLLERLLKYYNLTYEEYLQISRDVTIEDVRSHTYFKDIQKAVDFCKIAADLGKKIIIYGDYDADGIMGTSILVKMFQYVGVKAHYYVPSRYLDGYGINEINAQKIIDKGYGLVITVDNGITANKPIKMLKDAGIDVLILDHHQPQEILPEANYILHPSVSNYSDIATSGAFVAYMFSIAYLGYKDKFLATMASISLVSDMMPMLSHNRTLLKACISSYRKGEFPCIDLILGEDDFNESTIGTLIAPKINAIGRIVKDTSINHLVKFFTVNDQKLLLSYCEWINRINDERKTLSKIAAEKINEVIKKEEDAKAIVIQSDVSEGMIGLLANSLLREHNVPTVVFTQDFAHPEYLKGSARSYPGLNIVHIFDHVKDYAIAYGGHALAGGITIKKDDFEKVKELITYHVENAKLEPYTEEHIVLRLSEISLENYRLIQTFSPFGECWKAPLFMLRNIKSDGMRYSKSGEHLMTPIGQNTRIVGWNINKSCFINLPYFTCRGYLRISTFINRKYVDFVIKDFNNY